MNISQLLMKQTDSVKTAVSIIESAHQQFACVVDGKGKLIGTVTDGDIRRFLLSGGSLDTPIDSVMFTQFRYLNEGSTEQEAIALMRREMVHQIPVVDEQGRVVRVFALEEFLKLKGRANPVVIMAGGEGRRLRPLTQDCPKPMLRIGRKPLLEIILEHCIDAGFQHFYLSVNYLKGQIQDYFGDGERWHVRIDYLEEAQPLGTGGALSLLPQKPSVPLLVLNGDVLTRVNYSRLLRFHNQHGAAATLCVREHTTQIPYGVVRMNDQNVLTLEEKPVLTHFINAGIYLLDPVVLDLVPNNQFFDMPQLLETVMQNQHRVSAFPIHEDWLDVGHKDTLELAMREWAES